MLKDPETGHEIRLAHAGLSNLQIKQLANLPLYQAEGTQPSSDDDNSDDSGKPVTVNVNQAPPEDNPGAQLAGSPVNVPQVQSPQGESNVLPNGQPNPAAILRNQQLSDQVQRNVNVATGQADAERELGYQNALKQQTQRQQQRLNDHSQEVNNITTDMQNGFINPNHWQESQSTGNRVKNAFALALGGFGAGLVGGSNPAMDYINNQINRDIDAQRANQDTRKTILGAFQQRYGDGMVADSLTRAAVLDAYNHQGKQIAAQLGTPQAAANYLKFSADNAVQKQKSLQDAAADINQLPGTPGYNQIMGQAPAGSSAAPATSASASNAPMLQEKEPWYRQSPIDTVAGFLPGSKAADNGEQKEIPKLGGNSNNNSSLVPNAENLIKNKQKYDIYAKNPAMSGDLQKSYDQQVKIDQQLKQVDGLYDKLYSERGGLSGRIHRGLNPHAIAAGTGAIGTAAGAIAGAPMAGIGAVPGAIGGGTIGTAVGEGIGHALEAATNTKENQSYDADLQSLKGIISAALPGRGDQFVEEAAKQFAPTSQDTPKETIKKREAFKQFIVDHANNGILSEFHLVK